MMMGDGIKQTVITGNGRVVDGWTTFNSVTLAVVSPNFVIYDGHYYPEHSWSNQATGRGAFVVGSTFYRCSFKGVDISGRAVERVFSILGLSFMDIFINPTGKHMKWRFRAEYIILYMSSITIPDQAGSNTGNRVTWPGFHVINATNTAAVFTVSDYGLGCPKQECLTPVD
ncbi:hypothetical protein QYF36_009788 [Acer negundo]|nr:hypothetical protein QYF36_009788 [Acer negundo]